MSAGMASLEGAFLSAAREQLTRRRVESGALAGSSLAISGALSSDFWITAHSGVANQDGQEGAATHADFGSDPAHALQSPPEAAFEKTA